MILSPAITDLKEEGNVAWTSKTKALPTTAVVGHFNPNPNLIRRSPTKKSISFTPLELFGAAARCSHLSFVNPLIATAESNMIAKLVELHVDDTSVDFAILASADNLKDYVKSYFSGTVATGLAYLAMINESYVWSDHFENAGGGNATYGRKPDFVFGSPSAGAALMESKGSRSGALTGFDSTVRDGYIDQVEPHLGCHVGGVMATHGYCIGAWLKSASKGELRVHHTEVPAHDGHSGDAALPILTTIQRHSFATAFSLSHSPQLGADLRRGESRSREVGFFRTHWLGRDWLTNFGLVAPDWSHFGMWPLFLSHHWTEAHSVPLLGPHIFAIEETIATAALRSFLTAEEALTEVAGDIAPLEESVRNAARDYRSGIGGAAFPDGLAIFDQASVNLRFEPVVWDVKAARLYS